MENLRSGVQPMHAGRGYSTGGATFRFRLMGAHPASNVRFVVTRGLVFVLPWPARHAPGLDCTPSQNNRRSRDLVAAEVAVLYKLAQALRCWRIRE